MNETVLVLVVWATLCAVLVAYVVYRFVADKPDGSRPHPLYPLISRPTDRAIPPASARLQWAAYLCLVVGFIGFLVFLASEGGLISAPFFFAHIAGVSMFLGCFLLAMAQLGAKAE